MGVQGNHLEIQALSEMYNRPIHIYSYSAEPMNSFQVSTGGLISEGIFNLFPSSKKCAKSLFLNFFKLKVGKSQNEIWVSSNLPKSEPFLTDFCPRPIFEARAEVHQKS